MAGWNNAWVISQAVLIKECVTSCNTYISVEYKQVNKKHSLCEKIGDI